MMAVMCETFRVTLLPGGETFAAPANQTLLLAGLAARKLAAFAIGEPFAEPTPVAVPAEQLRSVEGLCAFDDSQANTPRRAHVPQVDAQLDFSGTEGPAATLTLLQGGRTLVMARR